jgi:hypothetical protein
VTSGLGHARLPTNRVRYGAPSTPPISISFIFVWLPYHIRQKYAYIYTYIYTLRNLIGYRQFITRTSRDVDTA